MNIAVVTGATSMIGIATIEACLKNGIKIYAVVHPGSPRISRLPEEQNLSVVECALEHYAALPMKIPEKCDVFYHFAWDGTGFRRNDDLDQQVKNIQYTLAAVRAAGKLGCKKFIGAGSQAEYGLLDIDKIGPSSPTNPIQPYGIAKYAAGKMAMEEAVREDIACVWVRIFSVYGKFDQPETMIRSAMASMKEGKRFLFTEGWQRWDYLYSRDAGEAFYRIGKYDTGEAKIYCLGSGKARPLREYIMKMREVINPKAPIGFGEIPYRKDAVMNLCADISTLQNDTGWKPSVAFEKGIAEILEEDKANI